MNFHDMPRGACISKPRAHRHLGPGPCGQRRLSRRQFARTAVSAVVVGATLGSGVWRPGLVQGRQPHAPVPISEGGFMGMRVFGPPQEISTITDFNGFVGIAIINGTMTKINMATGEIRTLPFLQADMRFMTGFFRDTAGQVVQGAFAFIWVDVFDPSLGTPPVQIHDLNPGIQSDGLFWTTAMPHEGVHVNLRKGVASLEATDVPITDFGNINNALSGGSPTTPGTVSFKVVWQGGDERLTVRNDDPPASGGSFAGEFIHNTAQMEWRATVGDVLMVSDVLATSSSTVAEIGHERNGSFFS